MDCRTKGGFVEGLALLWLSCANQEAQPLGLTDVDFAQASGCGALPFRWFTTFFFFPEATILGLHTTSGSNLEQLLSPFPALERALALGNMVGKQGLP